MKIIVFTDLDGTLLNHDDYSYKDAIPALNELKKRDIPIIITTSKTRKEVEILRKELNINDPFIVENGAAIFFEKGYKNFKIENYVEIDSYQVIILGETYEKIREVFEKLKEKYNLIGFGDLSVEEIAKLTNLPVEMAKYAKEREFTEPFLLKDENKIDEIEKEVQKYGLKITKGGRFYHLIGKNQDKGKAVRITKEIFEKNYKEKVSSIGLGDSKNDIPMLKEVDIPVLIKKYNGRYENVNLPNLIKSSYIGSKGWNEIILEFLYRLEVK